MSTVSNQDLSSMSMFDIFRLEAENHRAVLSDGLLSLEKNPTAPEVLEQLMRAAHSCKGAARIIGLDECVDVAHAMEDVFVQAQKNKLPVTAQVIDSLFEGVDFLADLAQIAEEHVGQWLADHHKQTQSLLKTLRDLAEKTAGPPDQPEITKQSTTVSTTQELDSDLKDLSMLDLFRLEVESHCANITDGLIGLEQGTAANDVVEGLMRAAHSIKGAARIVEHFDAVQLAHAMEDVFVEVQNGTMSLSRETIDLLLTGVDLLTDLTRIDDNNLPAMLADQQERFDEFIASCRRRTEKTTGQEQIPPAKSNSGQQQGSVAAFQAKTDSPARNRAIRVSAEGMNRLMGLAGEIQVESRWLPEFALKMLRLKYWHDETHRLLEHGREQLAGGRIKEFQNNTFGLLQEKSDATRTFVNDCLSNVEDHARRSTEISHRLYHEVIANRMLPFIDGARGFPRMIRDLARELGKEVQLDIIGEDTRVDRDILEKIEAPLNHLLRNALDHGIELPQQRQELGKSRKATIRLEAKHSSGMLNIIVSDDGAGIDLEQLRQAVVERKMIAGEMASELTEKELLEFIFLPGFSTRDAVSKVSGRGVGLDVVHNTIHEVRGIIRTSTLLGQGTTFEMQLPLTLSVMRALLVEINDEAYAFPLVALDHVLNLPKEQIKEVEGRQYITFENDRVGLVSARQVLELDPGRDDLSDNLLVLIISDRNNRYGLAVDHFLGVRDLVVQALDSRLRKLQDIIAAAILEDGTPVLIIDVEDIVHSIDNLISGNRLRRIDRLEEEERERALKRILVVDDSITVREVERKMLSARGYDIEVAIDGMDAWNAIKAEPFDLVVTDIDMPRMDGFQLVSLIKQDPVLNVIPVIIVSYKDRPEDRERGLEVGADYYLTKGSFQDETLVQAVADLIGTAHEV